MAPRAREAGERRQRQAAAGEVLSRRVWSGMANATPVTDPGESLGRLAGALEQMIDEASDQGDVQLFERALGHLRPLLVDMARLGLQERHVELEAERAAIVVAAMRAAIDAAGAELLPGTRDAMLRSFLGALGQPQPDVVAGDLA